MEGKKGGLNERTVRASERRQLVDFFPFVLRVKVNLKFDSLFLLKGAWLISVRGEHNENLRNLIGK